MSYCLKMVPQRGTRFLLQCRNSGSRQGMCWLHANERIKPAPLAYCKRILRTKNDLKRCRAPVKSGARYCEAHGD